MRVNRYHSAINLSAVTKTISIRIKIQCTSYRTRPNIHRLPAIISVNKLITICVIGVRLGLGGIQISIQIGVLTNSIK